MRMSEYVTDRGLFECRCCGGSICQGEPTVKVLVERPDLAAYEDRPNPAIIHANCYLTDGEKNQYRMLTEDEWTAEVCAQRLLE
jgi:hypothetical protein